MQFDDTHFQVESRTRNFFLCGDSKASTTCWVKSLDEYRKKLSEYEKEKAKHDALLLVAAQQAADAQLSALSPKGPAATVAHAPLSGDNKRTSSNKPPMPTANELRDSFASSSSSSRGSSVSAKLNSHSKRANRVNERQTRAEERRTPSPAESRGSRDREKARESGRGEKGDRERGDSHARASGSRANARQVENRSVSNASSVRAHPGKGYVMQAWVDEDL